MTQSIEAGLNTFCQRVFGAPASDPKLITGGANMEMWSFASGERDYVLRRYRGGIKPASFEREFDVVSEASVIDFAHAAGVTVPEVVGVLEPGDGLGLGFVMAKADGIALPQKLFKDPQYEQGLSNITDSFGRELARLHASDPAPIADLLVSMPPDVCLAKMREDFELSQFQNPVLGATMHWLETNLPDAEDGVVLLHGDFRMGNILINPQGLSAVLDWELVHLGCVEEDLAWICMPSWRFGRYHLEAGGVGTRDELLDAYDRHSERKVNRKRFEWYLVYSSLKWGLMTASMARMWRAGEDKSLERILIGTRISEVEADLLLMLEDIAGIGQAPVVRFEPNMRAPEAGDVRPSELMDAIGAWLSEKIIPGQSGADRFHALIANNALAIANRGTALGQQFSEASAERLNALGHTESSLFDALRAGSADWRDPEILRHMRSLCLERLTVQQPKYAALSVAQQKWRGDADV